VKEEDTFDLTSVEGDNTKYWVMKECDSRSWIGEEGISSRDQVKEKREHRQHMWVSVRGSHMKVSRRMELSIHDFYTCTWVLVDTITYIRGFVVARSRTPQKACSYGSYNRSYFARFVCNFIFLSGPLSLLQKL
jgi:hypothetical protein